ncbi:MAG: hypothetical protein COV66_08075 [Nitrospinae bacterium CG11_big_fil_rev_8_21_14_0_20_45_15]|nr:MAG: hypothetical protein COV66_08075 [Nitrospinae bacterium CG11_big_fil_rev_8_21_14_0_20_45_15]
MIKQLKIEGFKDQWRDICLTGLDLFTSDNVNGVGKSAVLESFKLAVLGELPGRAKNLDDIMKFTSHDEMSVGAEYDDGTRSVCFKRKFYREGKQGERRPVLIDRVALKYEEGNHWILQNIGAASIGFDPNEFLNMSGPKKLQWIIAHSPESWAMTQEWVLLVFLAKLTEKYLGAGLVSHLLAPYGISGMEALYDPKSPAPLAVLIQVLTEAFEKQEPELWKIIDRVLDSCCQVWSGSASGEENLKSIQRFLKSVSGERKGAIREQGSAIACMKKGEHLPVLDSADTERNAVRALEKEMESLCIALERAKVCHQSERKREERKHWLRDEISRLANQVPSGNENLEGRIAELSQGQVNLLPLEEELERVKVAYDLSCEECNAVQREEKELSQRTLLIREKAEAVDSARIRCPVAESIVCDTNMEPYRSALRAEMAELESSHEKIQLRIEELERNKESNHLNKTSASTRLETAKTWNDRIKRQLEELKEKQAFIQREASRLSGMANAYRNELFELERNYPFENEKLNPAPWEELESRKVVLLAEKNQHEEKLESILREEGKRRSLKEFQTKKRESEKELEVLKVLETLAGPGGMSREIAVSAAVALEKEVGEALRLLDENLKFAVDLRGREMVLGWNHDEKLIPLFTINSGHFMLFIVPFLATLVARLARLREKAGKRTLRALCIEAEALTPGNLEILLNGLSRMKDAGYVDNVLVAHYSSVKDPALLHGFHEHILKASEAVANAA